MPFPGKTIFIPRVRKCFSMAVELRNSTGRLSEAHVCPSGYPAILRWMRYVYPASRVFPLNLATLPSEREFPWLKNCCVSVDNILRLWRYLVCEEALSGFSDELKIKLQC
jgi:hypothetical protein